MANETEFANIQTIAARVSVELADVLRAAVIMPALCHVERFQPGSDSIKLRKSGSFAATAATESASHAKSEYTETSPSTLTVAEAKVYVELSSKMVKWSGAQVSHLVAEMAAACAQKLDSDAMGLFDGLSTSVGTTNTDLSPELLTEAGYLADAANATAQRAYVLHPKQLFDVKEDIVASSASIYTNPSFMRLLDGQPSMNGYRGDFLGLPVLISTNTESINTATDWSGALVSIGQTFALGDGGEVEVEVEKDVQAGLTKLAASLWYDVKEYQDATGINIVSKQA